MSLKACHCCGLIHRLPMLSAGQSARCTRCGATLVRAGGGALAASRTAAAAVGALVLFGPAVLLPLLRVERLGHWHESSLLGGTWELLVHGEWFVGLVVLLFSMVFPLVKLVLLLELSWFGLLHRRHQAMTYRVIEQAGRWSMMDVLLLALLVLLVKLNSLVEFHVGPGVVAFTACVAMSMVASAMFDPHAIWEQADEA